MFLVGAFINTSHCSLTMEYYTTININEIKQTWNGVSYSVLGLESKENKVVHIVSFSLKIYPNKDTGKSWEVVIQRN